MHFFVVETNGIDGLPDDGKPIKSIYPIFKNKIKNR